MSIDNDPDGMTPVSHWNGSPEMLVDALCTATMRVRLSIIQQLCLMRDPSYLDPLLQWLFLAENNWGEDFWAALPVFACAGDAGLQTLLPLTTHPDPFCRALVIRALGFFTDPTTLPALLVAADDPDFMVRIRCLESLTVCAQGLGVLPLVQHYRNQDHPPRMRVTIGMVLAQRRDLSLLDTFLLVVRDPNSWVRTSAVYGLGQLPTPQSYDALLRALRDRTVRVRCAAIDALRTYPDPRAQAVLALMAPDSSPTVRKVLARALAPNEEADVDDGT